MVLENGSSPGGSAESFDDVPQSDDDPYARSNEGYSKAISYENLPQPMPIFGPLFGFNESRLSRMINLRINTAATAIHRPLTSDEVDSFAYWGAKQVAIMSWSMPIGIAGGAWRSWNSASQFRFPFFQPPPDKFDPQIFVNSRWTLLKGNRAVLAWHTLRTFWYGAAGSFISNLLFGSYSMSVSTVGELQDKRLKNFMEDLIAMKKERQKLPHAGGISSGTKNTQVETQDYDDARPTAGMDVEGASGEHASGAQPQWRRTPPANPAPAHNYPAETKSQPFDIWDDASPTGGSGVSADTQSSQPAGSAWDRIRQGGRPAAQPPRRSSPSDGSQNGWARENTGEGLAFQSTEGDRSHEKDDAQRKFDAQVDRERKGGSFSSGAGDQKRW